MICTRTAATESHRGQKITFTFSLGFRNSDAYWPLGSNDTKCVKYTVQYVLSFFLSKVYYLEY